MGIKDVIFSLRGLRYFLFFLTLFIVISTFKVWKINKEIDTKIEVIKQTIKSTTDKLYFEKLFYDKFLENTGLSMMILSHKNGIPLNGEIIFRYNLYSGSRSKNNSLDNKEDTNGIEGQNVFYWYTFLKSKFKIFLR